MPGGKVNPWVIAFTVMLATFMEVLDTSVANVSLPHIAGNLAASVDESTWILTAYLVSNALVLPLGGWISMMIGRKRFYMTCVALFTISSVMCGFAPSLIFLVIARVFQGLGGGGLQPTSQAILVETFPKEKQGMAMAVYGIGVIVAPVVGPTLGGWITDNFSWRWIFLINVPVGILSLILTSALIEDPPYLKRRSAKSGMRLDYIGLALLTLGLGFGEYVLDEGERSDWFGSPMIVWSVIISTLALAAVVFWELRQKEPVLDFHILKDKNLSLGVFSIYLMGFILFGSTVLLPIFLQTVLGYTATLSGLVLSPGGIALGMMLPLVGFLLGKVQARWLMASGLFISSMATLHMSGFNLDIDFRTAVMARTFQMLGMAFLWVPMNTVAFSSVPKERMNYATGWLNLARNAGGSAGIAFVNTMLARREQFHQQNLVSHLIPGNMMYQNMLEGLAHQLAIQGASAADAMRQAQTMLYSTIQRHAAVLAVNDNFWLFGWLFLFMIPITLMMVNRPAKGKVHVD